jgi:hypothetical protein
MPSGRFAPTIMIYCNQLVDHGTIAVTDAIGIFKSHFETDKSPCLDLGHRIIKQSNDFKRHDLG